MCCKQVSIVADWSRFTTSHPDTKHANNQVRGIFQYGYSLEQRLIYYNPRRIKILRRRLAEVLLNTKSHSRILQRLSYADFNKLAGRVPQAQPFPFVGEIGLLIHAVRPGIPLEQAFRDNTSNV